MVNSGTKYKEFSSLNLPETEKEILQQWDKEQAFEKSISLRQGSKSFVFYEGPPSANGMPGIHHVISRTLKDLVCRYKTMKGFQVKRKGGWDTHGLPVELGVEKELGITKEDIGKKISVEEYNKKCREAVLRYKDKWDELTKRIGYWVDLENPYITFKNEYIETLWWLLKQLYNKGLLYEDVSIQPYSPAAGTGLSSHELNQPGCYKDVKDTSCVAMFKAVKNDKSKFLFSALNNFKSYYDIPSSNEILFLAWTTTPWTLPSNLGLTVGKNIDYLLIKTINQYSPHNNINIVIAKDLLKKYFTTKNLDSENDYELKVGYSFNFFSNNIAYLAMKDDRTELESEELRKKLLNEGKINYYEIIAEFKGKDLEGISYEQLLPFEANKTDNPNAFKILLGDFVTTEDGSGIVHTAPAFGADDFKVGKKYDIGILTMVDREGKFTDGLGEFSNRYVKNYKDDPNYEDVNVDICVKLKKENRAFKVEKYEHSYPHCWRTDKPILYYPLDAWFIKTTALKERMVELNKTINWKPKSTGEGRFGNWLENMVDWNLSRSRFWGTPLPVWRTTFEKSNELGIAQITNPVLPKVIGCISDLIGGYYFDTDKLRNDLINRDFNLKSIIEHLNQEGWQETEQFIEDEESLYVKPVLQINYEELVDYAKKEELAISDLVYDHDVTFNLAQHYSILIDESIIKKADLHRQWIDKVIFVANDNKAIYYRVPDLVDVWFDSGAMPYAQWHFPFENIETFADNYPADFIAEGVDQTRGWFYTLHAIAALVKESVHDELKKNGIEAADESYPGLAYKTCVSNGLVLDKNGVKMSKRLGNIVDPFKTIETFGADATRWYLITNASPWDNLRFDLEGIKEVQRKFFGTLYNTYQFFALYANVDGFAFNEDYIPVNERPEIDRWVLSSLNTLIKKVTEAMDDYEPTIAGRLIEEFLDEHLSNWYVRLSRRRFWKGEYEFDKISAYQTLYECLENITRLMAPVSPFFSDAVFKNLNAITNRIDASSVHHTNFPVTDEDLIDKDLEERMQLAQDVSSLILSLRKRTNIKVRQPLQKVLIPVLNAEMKFQLQKVKELIKAEVNVKQLEFVTEANNIIHKKIKPNFKVLGAKLGAKMKEASTVIGQLSQQEIAELEQSGSLLIQLKAGNWKLEAGEVEIIAEDIPGWSVASKGNLTVALDISLSDELKMEGDAREFINRIQSIRKDKGFNLTDRITVNVLDNTALKPSINTFKNYICAEILADDLNWVPEIKDGIEIEVNGNLLKVSVNKKG